MPSKMRSKLGLARAAAMAVKKNRPDLAKVIEAHLAAPPPAEDAAGAPPPVAAKEDPFAGHSEEAD